MALTVVPTNSTNQKLRIFSLLYHILAADVMATTILPLCLIGARRISER